MGADAARRPTTLCRTTLTYSACYDGEPGAKTVEVEIHDGRLADLPSWAECGFRLLAHHSNVTDWTDDEEIAAVHYAEVEALARDLTGCGTRPRLRSRQAQRVRTDGPANRSRCTSCTPTSPPATTTSCVGRTATCTAVRSHPRELRADG